MDLEHHQLELRYEGLRVCRADKERRVLSSMSAHGQQAPIVVVAGSSEGCYVVIDGHKRVRAARRLGQDTVRATVWQMGEAEALLLSRTLRTADAESALEQGWLLAELQSSFGLGQEELAQRFDRSPSWVSRRLALVAELPEPVQDEVRRGRIGAHAAMKHLVPMARAKRDDCERMAQAIAPLGLSTREIGELYTAWRNGGPMQRERVLAEPRLFVKARRELEQDPPMPSAAELLRDLDLAGVLVRRVARKYPQCRLDRQELEQLGSCVAQVLRDIERLKRHVDEEEESSAASRATGSHLGDAPTWGEPAADCQGPGGREGDSEEGDRLGLSHAAADRAGGEGGAVSAGDSRAACQLQGQPDAGARGAGGDGRRGVVPGADGVLPAAGDRHERAQAVRGVPLQAGPGEPARHLPAPREDGRQGAAGADGVAGPVLLADALLPVLSDLQPLPVQGLPDRGSPVHGGLVRDHDDRQHPRRGAAGHRG